MIWFIIGPALGCLHLFVSVTRNPINWNHPVQAFAFAAVLGALGYGTALWLLAWLLS
jgi:hypothetical protein